VRLRPGQLRAVGLENKIARARKGDPKISRIRPARLDRGARAAVDFTIMGYFFAGSKLRG